MYKFFLYTILLTQVIFAQTNRYELKSAIVEYDIQGKSYIMGMEALIVGNASLYFKDYGNTEYTMEKTSQKVMGEKEDSYAITKVVNNTIYSVDFEEQVIYEQKLVLEDEYSFIKNEKNLNSMGANKIGKEKILGYECDIWQLGEEKIWVYKTVPLKIEASSMGIIQTQIAKNAKFDIEIPKEKFNLPKFPTKKVEDMFFEEQSEMPELSIEQEKMIQELMKESQKGYKE